MKKPEESAISWEAVKAEVLFNKHEKKSIRATGINKITDCQHHCHHH